MAGQQSHRWCLWLPSCRAQRLLAALRPTPSLQRLQTGSSYEGVVYKTLLLISQVHAGVHHMQLLSRDAVLSVDGLPDTIICKVASANVQLLGWLRLMRPGSSAPCARLPMSADSDQKS